VSQELATELESSQPEVFARMAGGVPGLPISAGRWIGEMEEIAATFEHVGVTPGFHEGAAAMFRLLAQTPFAKETPETRDSSRTLAQTIAYLAKLLPAPGERRQVP
jgi:hypothetical protein